MAMSERLISAAVMISNFLLRQRWQGVEAFDREVIAKVQAAAAVSVCQIGGVAECRSGRGRSCIWLGRSMGYHQILMLALGDTGH